MHPIRRRSGTRNVTRKMQFLLHVEIDDDRKVIRRTPEIGQVLRIANRGRIVVPNNVSKSNPVIKRLRTVDEVDTGALTTGRRLELVRILFLDYVDIRRILPDVIMDKKFRIVIRIAILGIVDAGAGIEIAHHHPELVFCLRNRADRVLADVLHLHRTVLVSALFGL